MEIKNELFDEIFNSADLVPMDIQNDLKIVITQDYEIIKSVKSGRNEYELNLGKLIYPKENFKKDGEALTEYSHFCRGKWESIILPKNFLYSSKFYEEISKHEYSPPETDEKRKYLKELIMSIQSYLTNFKEPSIVFSRMGWHNKEFFIGNKRITKGKIIDIDLNINNNSLFEKYIHVGDYETYKNSVDVIFSKEIYFKHAIYYLMGISNPLYNVLGKSGVSVNARSEHSGIGKTLASLMSKGAYCKPDTLSAFSEVGVFNSASELNDLPLFLDEISTKIKDDPKTIINLIYTITTGVGKLKSSATVGKNLNPNTFRTMVLSNSNPDIMPLLERNEAMQSRMYQLSFEDTIDEKELRDLSKALSVLETNYGFGYKFISAIVDNYDLIKKELTELYESLNDKFVGGNFRYLSATFACTIMVARIYKKLGFNVDVEKVEKFLMETEVDRIKHLLKGSKITAEYILQEFFLKHAREIRHAVKGIGNTIVDKDEFQPSVYNAMIISTINEFRVNKKFFNDFLKNHPHLISSDYKSVKKYFDEANIRTEEGKIRMSGMSFSGITFHLPDSMMDKEPKLTKVEVTDDEIKDVFKNNYK